MIHIVEEIKLLLLLGNRLKHIRGNVSYMVTWNVKEFTHTHTYIYIYIYIYIYKHPFLSLYL
jgi:hypothetical protein